MPSTSYPTYRHRQKARLLYREPNPDESKGTRTPPQLLTMLNPGLVLFQHWAVEKVGERGNAYRFELQYYREGSQLRITPPGDPSRALYEEVPYGHRHIWKGETSMSLDEIHEMGQRYIDTRPRYRLGVSDCRGFALDLIHAIIDNKSPELILFKSFDAMVIKPLLRPLSGIVTPGLEMPGSIGGGGGGQPC